MNDKHDLVLQARNAFEFMQKFYLEVSFLIKEIEGMLANEGFTLLKTTGYKVSMKSSTGLEADKVKYWLPRSLSVAFVQGTEAKSKTFTKIVDDLKVVLVRVIVLDEDIVQPLVVSCVGYDFEVTTTGLKYFKKFESVLAHLEYDGLKNFVEEKSSRYEDKLIAFNGKTITNNLFDLNDSEAVKQKIVKPTLDLYNKITA